MLVGRSVPGGLILLALLLGQGAFGEGLAAAVEAGVGGVGGSEEVAPAGLDGLLREGAESWGLQVGYGYNFGIPTGPRTPVEMELVTLRWGAFSSPRSDWGVEGDLGRMEADGAFATCGIKGTHRWYFGVEESRALFFELGAGLIHLEHRVPEMATHTNFQLVGGFGAQFAARGSGAWEVQWRFQHVSNAGRAYPNTGLNNSLFLVGYTAYR